MSTAIGSVRLPAGAWAPARDVVLHAPYILDATEFGELLDLASVEHVIGSESRDETGEPHAPAGPSQPLDQQAITWCFALDYRPGEDHTIERPEDYDFWRDYAADFWPGPQLSWTDWHPETLEKRYRPIFDGPMERPHGGRPLALPADPVQRSLPARGASASDITLVNWPQIDYWLGPVVGVGEEERAASSARRPGSSRLSLLYWMQTEAPRLDGGTGYPELRLRPDVRRHRGRPGQDVLHPRGAPHPGRVHRPRAARRRRSAACRRVGAEPFRGQRRHRQLPDRSAPEHRRCGNYVDVSSYPFQIPLGA